MSETYVVDGSNVCFWCSQAHLEKLSISPLISLLIAILENGDDFYCVFDAPIIHNLNEQGRSADADCVETLLKQNPDRFFRVTGSTRADGVVLHYADHHGAKIITNDIYRDYRGKYVWLNDKYTDRLIQGNLQPSGLLTLDKLHYGNLSIIKDLQAANSRLITLIEVKNSPEMNELQKQVHELTQCRDNLQYECRQIESSRVALDRQLQTLQSEHHALEIQMAKARTEFEQQTKRLESVINDTEAASGELAKLRSSLAALYGIADLGVKEAELMTTLADLQSKITKIETEQEIKLQKYQSEIAELETQRSSKLLAIGDIQRKAQVYLDTLEQRRQAEEVRKQELEDEQACIRRAQSRIEEFLEPYGTRIEFKGNTWDAAVKKLKIYFDKNRICDHCCDNSSYHKKGDRCTCSKGHYTDNPRWLWKIVASCAPQKLCISDIMVGLFGKLLDYEIHDAKGESKV